ncbi:MAG TPA: hypothetical protein VMU43_13285 [Candidatus Acidoferrum sp.]|nr:hypothetical protein [Candidatus Acidoferrum sp.]
MSRYFAILVGAALLISAVSVRAQQQSTSASAQNQPAPAASANSSTSSAQAQPAAQTDSLADAARKARAAKQETAKPARVFTNDNIPSTGGISDFGSTSDAGNGSASSAASASSASNGTSYPAGNDEKGWRKLFDDLNRKLQQDQELVDVSQRELGQMGPQYYNDPTKTMLQELTRSDIDKKTAAIEQHKKDVEADKQAISDAEDALRRAGGDPGWAPR